MNISDLVTHYVAFRRTLGERCDTNEHILRSFCRAIGPRTRVNRIRAKAVAAFLNGTGPITRAWHGKYSALKGCFQFAVSRGDMDKAPLPTEVPKRPPTLVPYIYSRAEIRRLLDAIPSYRRFPSHMEPTTLRAILLLLYGAGLRRGEALKLSAADVDLANSLLTIRNTKFFKSRLVPISADLTKVLSDYARWRAAAHPSAGATSTFFLNKRGNAVHRCTLDNAFKRLREYAGVRRSDGGRFQPRLHDLRHAFAVHRLTEWYRQGAEVQRLVYHLSVYLGHAHLTDTQVYLTLTPELLQQASTRFERYARKEDGDA
ncbi:MAG: tyrosine-type recombinase/integrase [Planctomycetes bacterium]|nr:tyrosine-type recombinase/integrase [Planctomycetota bacterium]